jgi:glucosyl-dolichyl phosphate glucuronosyltransferase
MLRIAAIVCTHNRARRLRAALKSLEEQTLAQHEFEIVVVDNASTDETPAIVRSFMANMPNVRSVSESCLGLSHARNTGVRATSARYVAFLDDDARAEPTWLESMLRALETSENVAAGGRVLLDWEGPPPAWLPRSYWPVYTSLDYHSPARTLDAHEHIVGANMAFHREMLLQAGTFNAALGRRGTSLLSGEEAAVVRSIRSQGHAIRYVPDALVWHAVPRERRTVRWFLRRMFWDGASQPLLDYGPSHCSHFYLLQMYRDIRRIGYFCRAAVIAWFHGRPEQRLDAVLRAVQRLGRLRANTQLALRARRLP